ncbi:CAMK protein kinase [Fusarium oxysporum NRRL 32931]|uniref:CAMK protein kinase n=1 Tax=Fusarium oxysporum NRRL 32931 TaxID=660029 RepID=W9HJF4_FUSOX|nr:CAMK protein kinase [Fusarium oxysporum NRRL 32931]
MESRISSAHGNMDEIVSDIVRDYKLATSREGIFTCHFHDDPDAPPSSPQRKEVWKKKCNIGRGGQGELILQTCVKGSRHYTDRAVKKIWLQSRDSNSKRRYERELAAIVKFSHDRYSKYFVKSLGWYASSTKLYIAMEYLPAGDLYTYVREYRILNEEECRQVTCQVLSGIALMHAEGYAHRDIKPQNVLIYRYPQDDSSTLWWIKLGDFGISKRFSPDAATNTTASLGTLYYMAPELLRADSSTNLTRDYQKADMWALGVTAFFIFTNSVPFQSPASTIEFSANLGKPFPSSPLDDHRMSQDGQHFIREAIRPRPEARPDCGLAMRHIWVQHLFTEGVPDRTSNASSRASSFDSDTEEILTLTSRPNSPGQTIENQTLGKQAPLTLPPPHSIEEIMLSRQLGPAVRAGNIDKVNTLLDRGVDSNSPDESGSLPLYISISNGDTRISRVLCERGANIMVIDSKGSTALHLAIEKNQLDIIKLLIHHGCDIEATNTLVEPPLYFAVQTGFEAAVRLLIENGALLGAGKCGITPLMVATRKRHLEVAKLLLEAGAHANARDEWGVTALMNAAHANSQSIARLLISHGARLDDRDDEGRTALFHAANNGHQDTLKFLLEVASDTESVNNNGATSLIIAARKGHLAVVDMLLKKGANLEAKDYGGETPLVEAVAEGPVALVELLLENGADYEAKAKTGETCLLLAELRGNKSIKDLLLKRGAKKGLSYYRARFW